MFRNHEGEVATADRLEELVRAGRDRWRRRDGDLSSLIEPRPAHQASAAPEIQARALAQMQSTLEQIERGIQEQPQKTAEVESALRDTSGRLNYGVTMLETEVDRLSQEISRLASAGPAGVAAAPTEPTNHAQGVQPEPSVERRPPHSIESQFQPGGKAMAVIFAGVPSFETLMELQRGLTGLQQALGVSVTEYEDGVAKLDLELRAPASARQIAAGLRSSTGRQFLVEEADPVANRLRLSFIEHGREPERPVSSGLRADLWQKA